MFGWFRRRPEDEIVSDSVPLTTLIRWYIYDVDSKNANSLASSFDLVPVSEEGEEKERKDSEIRRARIEPLVPLMEIFSEINAKAISIIQKEELEKIGIAEDQMKIESEFLEVFYENLSLAALTSTLSTAAQLGLITINGTITDIGERDE